MTSLNMRAIQTVTVGAGGAASIDFTSIPQTYTDLVIVYSLRTAQAGTYVDGLGVRFNGDSGNNYPFTQLFGTGSSGTGTSGGTVSFIYGRPINGSTSTANTFGNGQIYIPNYTSSNSKSVSVDSVTEGNTTGSDQGFVAHRWTGTAAITSISMFDFNGSNLVQYSSATLYGISNAAVAANATGGAIYIAGNDIYHIFTSSGTFTPSTNLTNADFLVVAGGGGAFDYGSGAGGGGAGGLRTSYGSTSGGGSSAESKVSFTSGTSYTVTVGAGGAVQTHNSGGTPASAGNGSSSSIAGSGFTTITSTGGGGGADYSNAGGTTGNGATGGSGGGAGSSGSINYTGGAGTANQGYNGGNNIPDGSSGGNAGGGGGAGGAGQNPTSSTGTNDGGAGGAGLAVSITGTSVTYATGGKGGRNGGAVVNGPANSGNGGARGSAGGSGVVIIRYTKV